MIDLGSHHYFLGVATHHIPNGLFLCQDKYAFELLSHANMEDCNPCATPIEARSKLPATTGAPVANATLYRSIFNTSLSLGQI